ncbi:hypothetical protein E3T26_14360 [Cryobacterium sp. TMT1-21]|uniref:hypothetical protein n=1 Tax=Cryobacterium sp. TMT1-21 TaxID=1259234 RepID=UPI00106DC32A|nr:hypothetical protein [Cryobacterium sp. TMT1-21]TFD09807.1 hypothetical protein E3T26_14360 [Cryobacterium sp. TMT1-21]
MQTFIWALLIASAVGILAGAPSVDRRRTPSWFDLLPYLSPSKKGSGRLQQTAAHRKRKTRR